ncbi:MAG: hypothetical protein ACRD40_04135 [Candidatus Acidiferrales bacterium]
MNEQAECNQALLASPIQEIVQARQALAENKADPSIERHSRKCQICRHPDRDEMEKEYVEWAKPWAISRHYDVPERAIRRHFEAVGLISRRRANLVGALENIVERGPEAPITGSMVIRAVKAICCINGDNKWTEPAKKIIHTVRTAPKLAPLAPEESPQLLPEVFQH